MRKLSNIAGSISNSETSGYYGNSAETLTSKSLIVKANSVSMLMIFNHYGLHLDEQNRKMICPFPSHKGGHESSPSFYFYSQTNSFYCFGCKTGIRCCDFVSNMDKISKIKAAYKILNLFKYDKYNIMPDKDDFSETENINIILDFSNNIRDFRKANNDEKSYIFIENICKVYDALNIKHNLNIDALQSVVSQLKERIKNYIP